MNFSDGDVARIELKELKESEPSPVGKIGVRLEQRFNQLGRTLVKQWLETFDQVDPTPTTSCRWCGREARLVSRRARILNTPFGAVRYQRPYYVCPDCHHSTCPMDEWLNPYESLRELRTQLAGGASIPVDELAKTWKLGKSRPVGDSTPIYNWSVPQDETASPIKLDLSRYTLQHRMDTPDPDAFQA